MIPDIIPTEVYLYHKPIGLIVSKDDEKNRPTIFSDLPKFMNGMFSVGRLDKNTSGLLLITNDGELSRYLEHPKNSIKRTYLVNLDKNISEKKLNEYNKIIEDIKKEARKILDDNKKRLETDIKNKKQKFIVSADYDGLICACLLYTSDAADE